MNQSTFCVDETADTFVDMLDGFDLTLVQWRLPEGTLVRKLMRPKRQEELLAYLLLVRALRLADQRSQMKGW